MKVLIACEFSGVVRDAFLAQGHNAWSCDLLPSKSRRRKHIEGDVLSILNQKWDLMIAHPPCTHLAVSGARWFPLKQKEQEAALLRPTKIVKGRIARVHLEPPGPDRWKNRSRTYQGLADAMAEQWGVLSVAR